MRTALIATCLVLALPFALPAQAKDSPDPALLAIVASPARSSQDISKPPSHEMITNH